MHLRENIIFSEKNRHNTKWNNVSTITNKFSYLSDEQLQGNRWFILISSNQNVFLTTQLPCTYQNNYIVRARSNDYVAMAAFYKQGARAIHMHEPHDDFNQITLLIINELLSISAQNHNHMRIMPFFLCPTTIGKIRSRNLNSDSRISRICENHSSLLLLLVWKVSSHRVKQKQLIIAAVRLLHHIC